MPEVFHRNFFIEGPAGKLEALLWTTAVGEFPLVALVCHPHPLYGGTMHNKVVFQTAKTLHLRGIPVLRFNFRGTGLSEGEHDRGHGEQDDVRAALGYLAAEFRGRPVLLAGFSFGSWVSMRVGCKDARVAEMIGIGLPVDNVDMSFLSGCAKQKLIVQGANDQYGSRANIEALFASIPEPKRLAVVEGADHFFTGRLEQAGASIDAWLDERYPVSAPFEEREIE